jgi:DNA mismatch repair protein MutS
MLTSPPRESAVWKTPLYEQFWRLKDQAPGCLLFFRLGDFYELFGQDAVVAAPLMEVQLTSRDKSSAEPIPMCGVPAHAVDNYAEKLLSQGHKVALAEQISEVVQGKTKIVDRKIIRILTAGLPVDDAKLEARSAHWLVTVGVESSHGSRGLQVCAYDFLGGALFEGVVANNIAWAELLDRLAPHEILAPVEWLDDINKIPLRFRTRVTPWPQASARSSLEDYILYTQRCERSKLKDLLPEAKDLSKLLGVGTGPWARAPLNVLEHWSLAPELMDLLDGTGSAVGARRLRNMLSSPLRSVSRIQNRQHLIRTLRPVSDAVLEKSRDVYDLERILGRFRVGVAQPRELLRLRASLAASLEAFAVAPSESEAWTQFTKEEGLPPLSSVSSRVRDLLGLLESALLNDVLPSAELSQFVRPGFDAEFDRLANISANMQSWLESYESRLRDETGIGSLKVRSNRVFGYYIEVTKAHLSKVPSHFERKQTTVGGERFTAAELRERETEILTAAVRTERRASEILESLKNHILECESQLRTWIDHFAWLDAWCGLIVRVRRESRFGPWVEARVQEGPFYFSIQEGRHPLVETLTGAFVPNSLDLGRPGNPRLLVLTGPNMAGKSTLMRQAGIALWLAQCGVPVPAQSMEFAPCSGFYSRMGARDRILAGESTFMVEMKELATIFREADESSFVLLDEIGRGTSTQDGLAIAMASLEHLHNEVRAVGVFATHYHELSQSAERLPHAMNGSMGIREWEGDLVFLRTLESKPAESSYGIFVAKLAGLPETLLQTAESKFLELRSAELQSGAHQSRRRKTLVDTQQLTLPLTPTKVESSPENKIPLLKDLKALDLDAVSPREAWIFLDRLKSEIKDS